jgi:hypothetical protein
LKHACHCQRLAPEHRRQANELKCDESTGALVEKLEQQDPVGDRSISKRVKLNEEVAGGSGSATLEIAVGEAGRKLLQAKLDLAVIHLICAAGLPPTLIDYPQWKYMFGLANSRYNPSSSTKFADDLIPGEAARVRALVLEYLKTQYDLTISYDGATIKKPQSVYTVHFTTADGQSFLIEGQEASDESHTGEHISRLLLRTMDLIGRLRFSGISGDSTGNTKLGRALTCEEVATIINLPDVCHHTGLACKDIGKLPIFKEVHNFCLSEFAIGTLSYLSSLLC